jgi:flagellar biosynthesis protein FlhF
MRIKSYFAPAVEDAIKQARQELGEEAMLVKTRRSMPEARHLGAYEVIFAAEVPEAAAGEVLDARPPERGASPAPDRLSLEIAELKRELEGMRRSLACSAFTPPQGLPGSIDAAGAYAALVGADVAPELARELVDAAEQRRIAAMPEAERAGALGPDPKGSWLAEEIESRVTTQAELGRGGRPRVVALVGPPGSGKTSTLVKLAVSFGLASRRPAVLLSVDTYRIAAAEQLRCYAAILGIGCQVLETTAALAQAIEENGSKDLILIDTPGLGPGDLEIAAGLARLVSARSDIDTHLVLPASMKSGDLARTAAAYEIFAPNKLLFTKLDETDTFGPILNQAIRTGKALSFFTSGQRIPEDLETATRRRLTELVLAGRRAAAREARTAA